jgi:Mrp family chromosome partitioning ATPase
MLEFIAMARANADLVVFDTPPALVVTDASVLAPHVDGIVLVLDEEKTKMRAAALTCQMFKMVGGKILGIVVNKFDTRHSGYGGYYYYQYGGYYGTDNDDRDGGSSMDHSDMGPGTRRHIPTMQPGTRRHSPSVIRASRR